MDNSIHIGISALHIRPGQVSSHEPYLSNLVQALAACDRVNRYTVFVTPENRPLFARRAPGFSYVVYPVLCQARLVRVAFDQFVLPVDSARRGIDVVHYPGTVGSVFMRRQDVVTVHSDSVTQAHSMSGWRRAYFNFLLRAANTRAGCQIVPTEAYADELIQIFGYGRERLAVVHHGVNPVFCPQSEEAVERARRQYDIAPTAVLSVTNMLAHKNVPNLIRAFERLALRDGVSEQLVLVGNVNTDKLLAILADVSSNSEQLQKKISTLGVLPHEELPPLYQAAGVFAFVSLTETFGMPLTEALACGVPIVASDLPVHREVLGGAGLLVDPRDPESIAGACSRVLSDSALRADLRRASLARAPGFSWERTARETIDVYRRAYRMRTAQASLR